MGSPSPTALSRVNGSLWNPRAWVWAAVVVAAIAGGTAVTLAPTAYILAFVALALIVAVFLWRSGDAIVPFVLLVAAIQGGVLLRLPLGDTPIATVMPVLGGWTLVSVLVGRKPVLATPMAERHGRALPHSLIGLAVISALTAAAQSWRPGGQPLDLSAVLTLVQLGVLVWLTPRVLYSPKRVLWVAYVTTTAGAIVSVVALANRAGLVTIGTELEYVEGYTRVSGLLDDPNFFSFQLLISLAFAAHVALAVRTTLGRILAWSALALILAGVVSSYSAGALVGVAAVVVATIVLQVKVSVRRALAALVLIAVVTAVVAATAPPGYTEAVKSKYVGLADSSFEQLGTKRGAAWEAAAKEFVKNPVVGVGLSTKNTQAAIAEEYTLERTSRKAAHNMYLGIAVGTGILGLAAFLAILGSCFSILWFVYSKATAERQSETTLASACLLTAMAVVATQGLQLDLEFDKYLWLLVGASLAARHWSVASSDDRTRSI